MGYCYKHKMVTAYGEDCPYCKENEQDTQEYI